MNQDNTVNCKNTEQPLNTNTMLKIMKTRIKRINRMRVKLGIKTKALWFAAKVIADKKLVPGKDQEAVYEMLKVIGKDDYNKEQAKLKAEKEEKTRDQLRYHSSSRAYYPHLPVHHRLYNKGLSHRTRAGGGTRLRRPLLRGCGERCRF